MPEGPQSCPEILAFPAWPTLGEKYLRAIVGVRPHVRPTSSGGRRPGGMPAKKGKGRHVTAGRRRSTRPGRWSILILPEYPGPQRGSPVALLGGCRTKPPSLSSISNTRGLAVRSAAGDPVGFPDQNAFSVIRL
jgi:hypothetical protein